MTLAIIILSYIWWFADLTEVFQVKSSNLIFSGALVTLVSWQVSTPWGVAMLCVAVFMCVIAAIIKAIN